MQPQSAIHQYADPSAAGGRAHPMAQFASEANELGAGQVCYVLRRRAAAGWTETTRWPTEQAAMVALAGYVRQVWERTRTDVPPAADREAVAAYYGHVRGEAYELSSRPLRARS